MKNKRSLLLILLLVGVSAFSACGKQSAVTQTEAPEMIETNEQINLTLWGASEDAELLQIIADNFVSEHKDEASISITIDYASESQCKDMILNDIFNAPDVFTFADDQLSALAAGGVLRPVAYNPSEIQSRNSGASVSAASINGTLFAYPLTADNGYFLYYNKKYFKESDLETLDGILKIATENEKQVTFDLGSGWYLYSLFGNTGLKVGVNDAGIYNYCDWNSVENEIKGVDVCSAIVDFATNPGFLSGGDGALTEGAANDTVIAGVSGVWIATQLKEIWGDDLGAAKLPTYTVNGKQVQMCSFAGYKMVGVNSYSDNVEWAERLADFITNETNQTLRFNMREQGPSNTNAAASPEVYKSPAIQALIAQSEFSTLQRIGAAYWDATATLGSTLANGNPENKDLQEVIDKAVDGITAMN